MTPKQALDLFDRVISRVSLTHEGRKQVVEAYEILHGLIEKKDG